VFNWKIKFQSGVPELTGSEMTIFLLTAQENLDIFTADKSE